MNDIHYNKEELQKKLEILEESEKIDSAIQFSRCPVCGGELEYVFNQGGGDSMVTPYSAEIKCKKCDMFSKVIRRNSQQSYLWNSDGSDEISLKRDVWNSVKGYVKQADTRKEIYDLLIKLRDLSEAFNNMTGYLYSGICADEINEIIETLKTKYDVNVNYWQPSAGRVSFTNLQSLIEKYGREW
jgi:uncharacterized protein YeeX (DUF496 family)